MDFNEWQTGFSALFYCGQNKFSCLFAIVNEVISVVWFKRAPHTAKLKDIYFTAIVFAQVHSSAIQSERRRKCMRTMNRIDRYLCNKIVNWVCKMLELLFRPQGKQMQKHKA